MYKEYISGGYIASYVIYLPIYFRIASLAQGQLYDCPSASEATLWVK